MTQHSLLDLPAVRTKVRKRVRETSRAQFVDGMERFKGRKAQVLRWLEGYCDMHNDSPTSAELVRSVSRLEHASIWQPGTSYDAQILYVRRALSDLQAAGIVESVPNGQRECTATKRRCETWRITAR